MKIKTLCLLTSLAVAATAAAQSPRGACSASDCPKQRPCGAATSTAALAPLEANAQQALLFQIEEERMAGEIYAALGEKWELRQFRHIQRAERRHEQALRSLALRAGLSVPEAVAGKFTSPIVQGRYDALLAQGMRSAADALAAGAAVERQDIADLDTLRASVTGEFQQLVDSLRSASERHLAAFTRGQNGQSRDSSACNRADGRGRHGRRS